MKIFFERGVSWIMLVLLVGLSMYIMTMYSVENSGNLSRVLGSRMEIERVKSLRVTAFLISLLIFTVIYGVLYFSKRYSVKWLSALQILLTLIFIFVLIQGYFKVILILLILSWMVFSLNVYESTVEKKSEV